MIIALISFLGGITLFAGLDSYQGYLFRSDRDLVITALQRARAQSVGNICMGASCTNGKPHGVAISPAGRPQTLVIFQTAVMNPDYAHRDTSEDAFIEINPGTTVSGLSEVVFSPLSGNSPTAGSITIASSGGRISTITIGSAGQIFWTN